MREQQDLQGNGGMGENSWIDGPWVGFDTETTGISPARDRIVTAALVSWPKGRNLGVESRTEWLADPGVEIPERATAIHGVSTRQAQEEGRPAREVLEEVNASLAESLRSGATLVVFNAGYDLPLLEAESVRHQVAPLSSRVPELAPVADPLVLDRALVLKRRGKRNLSQLCLAYNVPSQEEAHRAGADAATTLALLAQMVRAHPSLASMPTGQLTGYQQRAHQTWAEEFEAYLRSQGRTTQISRTWF